MERADERPCPRLVVGRKAEVRTGQLFDALLHLAGGFVGERDRENILRSDACADDVGNAVHDDPGFAGSGSGKNQKRPFVMKDRLFLRGIEVVERIHATTIASPSSPTPHYFNTLFNKSQ